MLSWTILLPWWIWPIYLLEVLKLTIEWTKIYHIKSIKLMIVCILCTCSCYYCFIIQSIITLWIIILPYRQKFLPGKKKFPPFSCPSHGQNFYPAIFFLSYANEYVIHVHTQSQWWSLPHGWKFMRYKGTGIGEIFVQWKMYGNIIT